MTAPRRMKITVVVPILNEEKVLGRHTREIYDRLETDLRHFDWLLILVDNGSDDGTPAIAERLLSRMPRLRYERLEERGKGRAVRHGWEKYQADVNVFMDADLATDLEALVPLVEKILGGHDVAIGSRAHPDSIVRRSPLRKAVSLGFRTFLKTRFSTRIKDAPCGFKAVTGRVVSEVLPKVRNHHWFFDTELLLRSEHQGLSIVEVPVFWAERNPEGRRSRVGIAHVSMQYVREVERLRRDLKEG